MMQSDASVSIAETDASVYINESRYIGFYWLNMMHNFLLLKFILLKAGVNVSFVESWWKLMKSAVLQYLIFFFLIIY
jgi:hypothetical protein